MNLFTRFALCLFACGFLAVDGSARAEDAKPPKKIVLTAKWVSTTAGLDVQGAANTAVMTRFYEKNPDVQITGWSQLRLPGEMWQQADLLAFAGGVAADIQPLFFHQIQFYAQQGLLKPLNQFIGEDTNGDGVLSDDEIKWKPWLAIRPEFRRACMIGTKIYAVPSGSDAGGFLFRRDIFDAAGLDSTHPPGTLDAWWKACQKLTQPGANQYALSDDDLLAFEPFMFACGARLVRVEWLDAQGKPEGESSLEDDPAPWVKRGLKPRYRAGLTSPQAAEALQWIWKFRWAPWTRDPSTGEIRDLSEEEAARTPDVIRGVAYHSDSPEAKDRITLLRRGVIASTSVTISPRGADWDIPRAGMMPFPTLRDGDPEQGPLLPIMIGINSAITDPAKLDAAWRWVAFQTSAEAARIQDEVFVEQGYLSSLSTWELEHAGMTAELGDLGTQWREGQQRIFSSKKVIPYCNGWLAFSQEIQAGVIKPLLADPHFDYRAAMLDVSKHSDEKLFGILPPEVRAQRSSGAVVALFATVALLAFGGTTVVRHQIRQARDAASRAGGSRGARRRELFIATLMIVPALGLIALFQYYPVGRGTAMAFQNYHLVGGNHFVGVGNFAEGLFASRFGIAALNTLVFVLINITLGFAAPICLAFLLTEIRLGTVFFRVVYYLPAVTVGLVTALLWMRLYEPTPEGALNQLLHPLIAAWNAVASSGLKIDWPMRWLQNPHWAMLCVIAPSIWGGVGPGCLIYLAALKSVPEEMYEAADLDGASTWGKLRLVTLPMIFPLILVNFIGSFIGTFHSMGNILVMTGGGPNYATHVLALEIWQNAFLYLRFGVATAQAWMVAAALIGFVVMQIRLLGRLDWRQAGQ